MTLALRVDFLDPGDMKLITALIVILALTTPKIIEGSKERKRKARRRLERTNIMQTIWSRERGTIMLQLNQIHKIFNEGTPDEKIAIDHVNLTLQPGDFVTVIGSNGAGKSTLMNIISGCSNP